MSTFSAIVPDVVLSTCGVGVFFIFSTAKVRAELVNIGIVVNLSFQPIIQFVFRCSRVKSITTLTRTASPTGWRSGGEPSSVAETPQELLTFSISELSSGAKTASVALGDDHSLWLAKGVVTPDAEYGQEDGRSGHSKETRLSD
jgi:hypothetical protein